MKKPLPQDFDARAYVEQMQPYVGLEMDTNTCEEVSKLMTVAYTMATVVYDAPLDADETDFANVFIPGKKHD